MNLEKYPVVKVLIPFALGIIITYKTGLLRISFATVFIICAVLFIIAFVMYFPKSYRMQPFQFIVVEVAYFIAGVAAVKFHYPQDIVVEDNSGDYIMRVMSEPAMKERVVSLKAEILKSSVGERRRERVLLHIRKTDEAAELAYGDVIMVRASLSDIEFPHNPDAFNYREYMRRRGVCRSGFVDSTSWLKVGSRPPNPVVMYAMKTREKFANVYESSGMNGDELGVIRAILLGQGDLLDPDIKKAYSSAGVSHILCVSGMHVGIIFMIFNTLLMPLDFFRRTKWLKMVIVMAVIWSYAHITGLAPSVTRSATMFSFVSVGQMLRRNTDVFHSLFASLFILLFLNPMLLFEVGFQLSYLAVFGIVLFQPKIAQLVECKCKITKYFWELMTVSLAAQLATAPISIFYFSQFPNYFLLSNMSVITFSFIVVVTGVILLPISFIPLLSDFLAKLLTLEIKVMNAVIKFVENIPFSVTENIDYTVAQVILLYSVIVSLLLLSKYFNARTLVMNLSLVALFSITFPIKKNLRHCAAEELVYDIRKGSAVAFNYGGSSVLFSDVVVSGEDPAYRYNIEAHDRRMLMKTTFVDIDTAVYKTGYMCKVNQYVRFLDKTFMIVGRDFQIYDCEDAGFDVDCLVLRENSRVDMYDLWRAVRFKSVVADGSNSTFFIEKWRAYCSSANIPFLSTGERKIE